MQLRMFAQQGVSQLGSTMEDGICQVRWLKLAAQPNSEGSGEMVQSIAAYHKPRQWPAVLLSVMPYIT
jgi:hypothetical protein